MTVYDNEFQFEDNWTYEDLNVLNLAGSRCGTGWIFFLKNNAGGLVQLHPTIDGEMSFDTTRDVRRTISGQVLLPTEFSKLPSSGAEMYAFLVRDTDVYPMGVFLLSELSLQPDVILDPDDPTSVADLVHVSWGDRFLRLRANDGTSQNIFEGADPSFEMSQLLTAADLPYSIANAVSLTSADLVWDGTARLYEKISTLAELAGHRPPWMDNTGTFRSVVGGLDPYDIIQLEDLLPVADSIMVSENYLNAPNRVIVVDSSGASFPIRGQWDAPASAPHSEFRRGWVQTEIIQVQGLRTSDHAESVARTAGESFTGRTLNCSLARPTHVLDGPIFLRYAEANWIVTNWSVGLGPNEPMSLEAVEFFGVEISNDVGRVVA